MRPGVRTCPTAPLLTVPRPEMDSIFPVRLGVPRRMYRKMPAPQGRVARERMRGAACQHAASAADPE